MLLIDADLRKPTFKAATNKQGLTKLLTTEEPVREHVVMTQYDNLWLMPCGPIPPNPADLLSTARFQAMLAEAAEHFDFVIIDSPPVLGLADAPLLARCLQRHDARRRKRQDPDQGGDRGDQSARSARAPTSSARRSPSRSSGPVATAMATSRINMEPSAMSATKS